MRDLRPRARKQVLLKAIEKEKVSTSSSGSPTSRVISRLCDHAVEMEGALSDGMGATARRSRANAIEESDMIAIPDPTTFT
jgi:hypothetical protein